MSRFGHFGGCTKSAVSEGAFVAGPPTAGDRAGKGPWLRTAGQGRTSHHGLSPLAHLGRERPRGARPFPAADKRAFHRRTMRAAREDAFPIHSRRWLCSPHPRQPQPGDCKLGTAAVSQPPPAPPTPRCPHPAPLASAELQSAKKPEWNTPPHPPPSPRSFKPKGRTSGLRPSPMASPALSRRARQTRPRGHAGDPCVQSPPPPVRGERGCAHRPKKRQSGRLCAAAAAARRELGTGAHLSAGTARRPRAARPGARPPRRRRHASRRRRSGGLWEERHCHARGLSAERESSLPSRAQASSPPAPRTHPPDLRRSRPSPPRPAQTPPPPGP